MSAIDQDWVRDAIERHSDASGGNGRNFHNGAYAAIADELNATLGAGTCCIEERHGDWYCTGCGEMVGTCDTASELCIDGNAIALWHFCPNCGRRVE